MASDGREGGYIKLHRQIESWPLWKSMPVGQRMVWVQLLLCANWKTDVLWFGTERVTVERGTLAHSEAEIARRAGVGRQVVRDALAKLQREGAITRQKSLPGNHAPWLVTIVNYERFQGFDEPENPRPPPAKTNEEPTRNQRGTLREEAEEGEEEKQRSAPASVSPIRPLSIHLQGQCPKLADLLKRAADAGVGVNAGLRAAPWGEAEALIEQVGPEAALAAWTAAAARRTGGQDSIPLTYLLGPLRDAAKRGPAQTPRRVTAAAADHTQFAGGKRDWT